MDLGVITQLAQGAFGGAFLIAFIVGLQRRWWVLGDTHQAVARERDAWREMALRALNASEQSLEALRAAQRETIP